MSEKLDEVLQEIGNTKMPLEKVQLILDNIESLVEETKRSYVEEAPWLESLGQYVGTILAYKRGDGNLAIHNRAQAIMKKIQNLMREAKQ